MKHAATRVLLVALLICGPGVVQAGDEWGHRYMVYGRILDAEGEPAQDVPVRVRIETIKGQDPYMTVRTDCHGLYHTRKDATDTAGAYGEAPDWGVGDHAFHIHQSEYRDRGVYHVHVLNGTDDMFHGAWRLDTAVGRSTRNILLDETVAPAPACAGGPAWNTTYVVTGRIQHAVEGGGREDAMTRPQHGEHHTVTVTLSTRDGPRTMVIDTDAFGDYFALFEDVDVGAGDRASVRYRDVEEAAAVDLDHRVTHLDAFVALPALSQLTLTILLVSGALILIGGLGIWGYFRARGSSER